jgi:hypothetical protein
MSRFFLYFAVNKIFTLLLIFPLFISQGTALPVGNPANPNIFYARVWQDQFDFSGSWRHARDLFHLTASYYGDFVYNRHLHLNNELGDPTIEKCKLFTNAGYFSLLIWNHAEFFATFGKTRILLDSNNRAFDFGGSGRYILETSSDSSWSAGGRLTLIQCPRCIVGIEGQYFKTEPDIHRVSLDADSLFPEDAALRYVEAQLSAGIAAHLYALVPYIAAKYSWASMHFIEPFITDMPHHLINHKHWGFALGCTLLDSSRFFITVEGRWADETALYLNGSLYF